MRQNSKQAHTAFGSRGRGFSPLGWLGMLIFPIAAFFYLIALPFFGVLWLLEFFLPKHPDEAVMEDLPEEPQVQFPQHGGQEFKLR